MSSSRSWYDWAADWLIYIGKTVGQLNERCDRIADKLDDKFEALERKLDEIMSKISDDNKTAFENYKAKAEAKIESLKSTNSTLTSENQSLKDQLATVPENDDAEVQAVTDEMNAAAEAIDAQS